MFLKKIIILTLLNCNIWGLELHVPKVKSTTVPIIEAIKAKKYQKFQKFFNKSKLHKRYSQNQTLLHYASRYNNQKVVKVLVEKGALLNAIGGEYNATPLHEAIRYGHLSVAVYLIKNNTPLNDKDKYGEMPLDIAKRLKYTNIIELLEQHGAKQKDGYSKNGGGEKNITNKYSNGFSVNKYKDNPRVHQTKIDANSVKLRHNKFESENKDKNNKNLGKKNFQIDIGN